MSNKKTFVDKVREVKYKLGEIYGSKTNTFYIIVGIEYVQYGYNWDNPGNRDNCRVTISRLGKNLKSQGNRATYRESDFIKKFKPLTEGQKLLFLHEEIKNE